MKDQGDRSKKYRKTSTKKWIVNLLEKNKKYVITLFVSLLIGSFLLISLTQLYSYNLKKMVDEESYGYLEEIASQMNKSLINGMTENNDVLASYAVKIKQADNWTLQKTFDDMENEAKIFNYRQLALIDCDGKWVTSDGTFTIPEILEYVSQMKNSQSSVTTPVISMFNEDCVVFLHPLDDVVKEGRTFVGIATMLDMEKLDEMLFLELFDGAGYSHVVTELGSIIIRSTHNSNDFKGYNLLTYLESSAEIQDGVTVDMIKEDFSKGEGRRIRYTINGHDNLSIYMPIEYENWYLFTVIPSNILLSRTNSFYEMTITICGVISALFLSLLIIIFIIHMHGHSKLTKQLYTDSITGGISRTKFELEAKDILSIEKKCTLIYANVKKFKLINEQNGSEAGDELLRGIYKIISDDLSESELVSRLMADHFGILLATTERNDIEKRINEWDNLINELITKFKFAAPIVMNYGILLVTSNDKSVNLLLDKANIARKSNSGSRKLAYYDEELISKFYFEAELESRQKYALENGEFLVYYQPKYSPKTDEIVGAEALVRWNMPDRGILSPDKFISLFEYNGFITQLDSYVLEKVCQLLKKLKDEGHNVVPISVNLSRYNLTYTDFILDYVRICEKYSIDPSLLEFEITESLMYENLEGLNVFKVLMFLLIIFINMDSKFLWMTLGQATLLLIC